MGTAGGDEEGVWGCKYCDSPGPVAAEGIGERPVRSQRTHSHKNNYAAGSGMRRERAEGGDVELKEQTGDEKRGEGHPRP
jgi:hypothetical protein